MSKISKVSYVDATYSTQIEGVHLKPRIHTAYGYVTDRDRSLVVSFIEKQPNWLSSVLKRKFIVKGLLIPKESLLSVTNTTGGLTQHAVGTRLRIWWRDVVYLANVYERPAHIMRTQGILKAVDKHYVLIENQTTKRTWPLPQRAHVQSAKLIMIPTQLIQRVKKYHE